VDVPPPHHPQQLDHVDLLRAFLAGEGMGHDWWVRMLLKHGRAFEPSPLPDDVPVMKPRCCYLNSYMLATEQPEWFTYYEGYAAMVRDKGWGTTHAWCVDLDGRVVDATWPNVTSDLPAAYLGLALPLDVVAPFVGLSRGTISEWGLEHSRDDLEQRLPACWASSRSRCPRPGYMTRTRVIAARLDDEKQAELPDVRGARSGSMLRRARP
jgi:hypothetical protein